ncbi:hypothetical protein MMC27_004481 [Xylographa pallens]|nr:hypothetical protein [Xylographa pallens]
MVPYEDFMVKKFKRSSPGDEQQLPSDIRPPHVLQNTLNYLFDAVVGGSRPLAEVHKFVWDRTRSIRNDFSIQQVTKTEDLRVAIDCFERMSRFHILSLHQLSYQDKVEFDAHQEREQLNNTLLSLMYYYDDSRSKLTSPNEAEFRAYCIIFEIESQRPDLEDRAQNWPNAVLKDPRIQTALKLHAAAGNTSDSQGPLRPRTAFSIAQANYGRFWTIIGSSAVPYLMACTAEIYFNFVRSMALNTIWKAYRRGGAIKLEDWIMSDVMEALGFDTEEQATNFCEEHGFSVGEREDGNSFLNLSSVSGTSLIDSNPRRAQIFSKNLVEKKRFGRTFPAVINGLSASQARLNGFVEEFHGEEGFLSTNTNDEPLFVNDEDISMVSASSDPPSTISVFAPTTETQGLSHQLQNPISQPHLPFATIFNQSPASNSFTPVPTPLPVLDPSSTGPASNSWGPHSATSSSSSPFGKSSTTTALQPASTSAQAIDTTNSPSTWPMASGHINSSSLPVPTAIPVSQLGNNSPKSLFNWSPISNTSQPTTAGSQMPSQISSLSQSTSISERRGNNPVLFDNASVLATPFKPNSPGQKSAAPFQFFPQPSNSNTTISPDFSSAVPNTTPGLAQSISTSVNTNSPGQATTQGSNPKLPLNSAPFSFATTSVVMDNHSSARPSFNNPPSPFSNHIPSYPRDSTQVPSFPQQYNNASNSNATSNTSFVSRTGSSNFLSSSSNRFKSPTNPVKPGPPKLDRRPQIIDQLANTVFCENNGILQQFVEHIIHPTIVKSIGKVKRERERAEIARVRSLVLGRKYLRRWKEIAWKRGLMRKGKERRKNFAQSMQALSQSTMQALHISRKVEAPGSPDPVESAYSMRPPKRLISSPLKRKSLPNGFSNEDTPHKTHKSHKSHRESHRDPSTESLNAPQQRPIKRHHKRSSTIDSTSHISNSSVSSRAQFSPISSFAGGASLLSDSVLKKARQLIPVGPTDTTRTDYFRLKAMGIDPNTQIVPATRKRRISDQVEVNPKRASLLSPPKPSISTIRPIPHASATPSGPFTIHHPVPNQTDDSDEELFAQVRQVKAAMSESMSWYREERQKSELSRSSSISHEPPAETAAERRLRELKHTPSRTEIRLRETGARGLLPKDWGARSLRTGMPEVLDMLREEDETPTRPKMGFAAVGGRGEEMGRRQEAGMGTGASADDAIEL